ncbi:hypothetical protein TrRE_jg4148 [Triparma retinervis]|uniref:Uncharacterized protein n=1 Tax=Triparma retinervis TaxID=2557542 RepID=A0A9W6Z5Y1_9STRA|nr:hypothetical protein TrRE_jg4148 [Triparma retinervis]
MVILQVILSLPVALVLAPLASVCAVTVNSPNFYNRLVNLYNTAVPSSVQEGKKSAITSFLSSLEKIGLGGLLVKGKETTNTASIAFSILEFALFFLTPFFAIFLTSVGNLCKKIEDDEDVEMGPAVVDTVMDAADGVLAEFQGLVSSGYAAVLTLTTVVFLVINHIF